MKPREGVFLGVILILVGFPIYYFARFTPILDSRIGLVKAGTTAFGLTLMLLGAIILIMSLNRLRVRALSVCK